MRLITHIGVEKVISANKLPDEQFRISGTAVNSIVSMPGVIVGVWETHLEVQTPTNIIRAIKSSNEFKLEDCVIVYEYYDINMESSGIKWIVSKTSIQDARHLFINIDVLKADKLIKQLRIDGFLGSYKLLEWIDGI